MGRDEVLERALSLFDEDEWEAGAELLRDHLVERGDDPALHCWLGVAERHLGLEGIAYERFKRALALEPSDPYVLATAGDGIAAFDDEEAEPALRAAALTAPEIPLTRLMYGAYLAREGLLEEAVRELRAARELDEDDPQIAYELGVAHALSEAWERANDAFSDAVRLAPDDGWVRVVFGLCLREAGRAEEAAGELVSAARELEQDVEASLAAALAAASVGHDDLAYEMLERGRIVASEPDQALVSAVEDRIDAGPEDAASMLDDTLGPRILRARLRERA